MANIKNLPFRHPQVGAFFQVQPKLENPYLGDGLLQRLIRRLVPNDEIYNDIHNDLSRFGERIRTEIDALGDECEKYTPQLVQYDPWGNRIDEIVTCNAWKKMKDISAEEELIALGYKSKHGPLFGRLHQFSKLFMYSPASGLFSCPLAMTDGAAKSIKSLNCQPLKPAFDNLTSSDPSQFWTSGQWMTERRGGSDVGSGTETIAVSMGGNQYKLYGYKWFSSATDSDMALTLARIADPDGTVKAGSSALSMFFVKTRKSDGSLNNIQVMKLKNKLGTRQLPTGELLLDGTEAELVSAPGRGVASISNMLTITRIHNGVASTSYMRRIVSLARDYSKRRICFGVPIYKYPLHVDTIAALELDTRACTSFVVELVRLLGRSEEAGQTEEEDNLLRLLCPVMKLYTGKRCVPVVSEGIECIGGQGYIEDTGIPKLLRDAQVTPIWEGTTNILSLDVLRAIAKSKGEVLKFWGKNLSERLKNSVKLRPDLGEKAANKIFINLEKLRNILQSQMVDERSARALAFSLAELTISMLLIEQASGSTGNKSDEIAAIRWVNKLPSIEERFHTKHNTEEGDSNELVFDSFNN